MVDGNEKVRIQRRVNEFFVLQPVHLWQYKKSIHSVWRRMMCISTKTVLKTIWTENVKAPGMFWIQKSYNWMKMNSVKYPVWLKVVSKPAILKYHRSQDSLKPQGIKDCLFVIMHETNWGKTQWEIETITERIARRYGTSAGGMPSGGRHCNKTSCSRRTSLPSGSCSKFFLRSDKHRNIFFKPKQPKKVLSFFFILSKKKACVMN